MVAKKQAVIPAVRPPIKLTGAASFADAVTRKGQPPAVTKRKQTQPKVHVEVTRVVAAPKPKKVALPVRLLKRGQFGQSRRIPISIEVIGDTKQPSYTRNMRVVVVDGVTYGINAGHTLADLKRLHVFAYGSAADTAALLASQAGKVAQPWHDASICGVNALYMLGIIKEYELQYHLSEATKLRLAAEAKALAASRASQLRTDLAQLRSQVEGMRKLHGKDIVNLHLVKLLPIPKPLKPTVTLKQAKVEANTASVHAPKEHGGGRLPSSKNLFKKGDRILHLARGTGVVSFVVDDKHVDILMNDKLGGSLANVEITGWTKQTTVADKPKAKRAKKSLTEKAEGFVRGAPGIDDSKAGVLLDARL